MEGMSPEEQREVRRLFEIEQYTRFNAWLEAKRKRDNAKAAKHFRAGDGVRILTPEQQKRMFGHG